MSEKPHRTKFTPNPIYTIKGNIYGSSAISAYAYDPKNNILLITFRGGNDARYRDVPPSVPKSLQSAVSAGTYFNQYIKNKYIQY